MKFVGISLISLIAFHETDHNYLIFKYFSMDFLKYFSNVFINFKLSNFSQQNIHTGLEKKFLIISLF